jgi:DNA adenine methylase
MNNLKSKLTPVRYPGGKSNAIKHIDKYFLMNFKEYREPFFGGGSIGLYLMQMHPGKKFWVNDLFYPVYCFWKVLYEHPNQMVKKIQSIKAKYIVKDDNIVQRLPDGKRIPSKSAQAGRELHLEARKKIEESIDQKEEFETACLWYILNKLSYSGMSMIGSYAPLAWDQNFTDKCISNLPETSKLLNTVKFNITNEDYNLLLIEPGDNVFIFLDPPYKIPHKLYGKEGNLHEQFNHQRFVENVKECSHKWMITYNQDKDIEEWFSQYHQYPWELQYTMKAAKRTVDGNLASEKNVDITIIKKSGKKGKELLIWNYDTYS